MSEKEFLKPSEVAKAIGVSVSRAYQLIAARELPACKVGGAIRVPRRSFEEWLRERNEVASAAVRRDVAATSLESVMPSRVAGGTHNDD